MTGQIFAMAGTASAPASIPAAAAVAAAISRENDGTVSAFTSGARLSLRFAMGLTAGNQQAGHGAARNNDDDDPEAYAVHVVASSMSHIFQGNLR